MPRFGGYPGTSKRLIYQPQRGCVICIGGTSTSQPQPRYGWRSIFFFPRVAAKTRQPWATRRSPVGATEEFTQASCANLDRRFALERAVVSLHRSSCLFNCLLASRRQCWFGLRVIGEFLPTASPLFDGRLVLGASNFRDLAGDAGVIRSYEIVTFRHSDFIPGGRCRRGGRRGARRHRG